MPRKGPKPTPTAILEARGSWLPRYREGEPQPGSPLPDPPETLTGKAAELWTEVSRQLQAMNVGREPDAHALARYCELTVKFWDECQQPNEGKHVERMCALNAALLRLEACFGLTPADRATLKVAPSAKSESKARFFEPKVVKSNGTDGKTRTTDGN